MRSSQTAVAPKVTYLKDYKVSDFLIDHVDLRFELNETKTLVTSRLHLRANPLADHVAAQLFLHGEHLDLLKVIVDGHELNEAAYMVTEDGLTICDVPSECVIEIHNAINPAANTALRGLYLSNNTFATHNEAQGFRRITYYLDRPDVMSTFTTTIIGDPLTCPLMLSNGNLKEEAVLPDGRHLICWEDPVRKPSYLFALVAGDLGYLEDHFVTMSGRDVNIKIYAKHKYVDRCHHAMQSLKNAMKWDEENYGRECDLDSYKVVAIDDFNIGAMENKGLNIFNTFALLATPATATDERFMRIQGTVAHEYFHNWTGDRITIRDWFQLSLKEGLTSNRDQSYSEAMFSKAARINAVRDVRSRQFPEDAGPLAHPVQPQSYITPDNFYTATIYRKGAEIYGMLHTRLGAEAYRKAMDLYFSRFDGQAITIEQYIATLSDSSGLDLSQFLRWFKQAGTPEVVVSETYLADTKEYVLSFKQSCPPTPGQPDKQPLPIPVSMGLIDQNGRSLPLFINGASVSQESAVLMLTESEQTFRFANIDKRPVPSLFRNFSAPVKWRFGYDNHDLKLLMEYDKDPFNRLEASERYMMNHLCLLITAAENHQSLQLPADFIDCLRDLLLSSRNDKWLLAEMLHVPSLAYIADQFDRINIDAIQNSRKFMINEIATQLKDVLLDSYSECMKEDKRTSFEGNSHQPFDPYEAANRRLQNICLSYLLELRHEDIQKLAFDIFESSLKTNLTNTMAVFRNIQKLNERQRASAIEQYQHAWQHEPLVFMEWFAVQASFADNIETVRDLFQHPQFDIKNPTAVNALLRGFSDNAKCFHAINGEGYYFLANAMLVLDEINPKMATSQVTYLTDWRRYDDVRRGHMQAALASILTHDISKDLYELVSKCLSEPALQLRPDDVPLRRIDGLFAVQHQPDEAPASAPSYCLVS